MPRKPTYDRNDLIDRARDLFWQRGWAGTSLKDLEVSLQLNPGSFYAAFGSKDALFALAMEKYASDGLARLEGLSKAHGPLKALQKFPAMIVENETAPAMACMLSKTFLELHTRDHPLADKANQHLIRMENLFADLFEQAQTAGEIDKERDPTALARRYQSDLLGLRVSAERDRVAAQAIAAEIADSLGRIGSNR